MEEGRQYSEYSVESNPRAYMTMRDYKNLAWKNQQPWERNPNLPRSKRYSKPIINRVQKSTFWALITPPNLHIASPLAMKERKKESTKRLHFKKVVKK